MENQLYIPGEKYIIQGAENYEEITSQNQWSLRVSMHTSFGYHFNMRYRHTSRNIKKVL
jgi:hypothetical protein